MEIRDNLVSTLQELLGLAGSFGPGSASFRDVLAHLRKTAIGAGGGKALGLDAHDLRIEVLGDGLHVVAIDRSEESFHRFGLCAHGSHSMTRRIFIDTEWTAPPWKK